MKLEYAKRTNLVYNGLRSKSQKPETLGNGTFRGEGVVEATELRRQK